MANRGARGRSEREARRRTRAYQVRQAVHADRRARRRRDDVTAAVVLVAVAALATTAQVLFFTVGPGVPAKPVTPMPTPTTSVSASPSPTP